MLARRMSLLVGGITLAVVGGSAAVAEIRPHAGMLRFPDVSETQIVFVYAGDLWLVPREGGVAVPLASPPGGESFPRFSADGQTIAFVGNYDGNDDLYTIPVGGGVPERVTHHPATENLCDWTPDGRLLFFSRGYFGLRRQTHLLTVAPTGGLPEQLPVPYGAVGSISPDGEWLAYSPYTRDGRTWKRYLGGMASDIWLFNLRDHSARKITDWDGTDSQPMWLGKTLYYMCDAGPAHRLNIWTCDIASGRRQQITHFEKFDVAWPAIGPGPDGKGEIVFQNGPNLYLLDLGTRRTHVVEVIVPGDRPNLRPQRVDVSDYVEGGDISATGKRVVLEARGDIWTVPAKKGAPRNLTHTSGVAERDPTWSPDGRWISYFADETGEYELYVTQSDGKGETRQLTKDGKTYRYSRSWSPDSKYIVFADKTGAIYLTAVETGETKLVDRDPWADDPSVSWSHDSNWLAYTLGGDNQQSAIWLYHVPDGKRHQVTSGTFNDSQPTFDRKGEYLFFASNRHFHRPIYEDLGNTFVYTNTDVLVVVPLRDEVGSPWAPESDEESWDDDDEDGGGEDEDAEDEDGDEDEAEDNEGDEDDGGDADDDVDKPDDDDGDEKKEEEKPLEIELDGFEQRALRVPVEPGEFYQLEVNDKGHLLYVRGTPRGVKGEPAIKLFDLEDDDEEEKTVLSDVGGFAISADGKKLLVSRNDTLGIVDAKPDQKLDEPLALDGLTAVINPREEWRQLFIEAWRVERDFFYDPNMHGLDWAGMRDHYIKMLADCVSRADVGLVIRELIGELNVGHAYYIGDDSDDDELHVSVGMLGADFELHEGAYRIKTIHAGGVWDLDARGPLSRPGVDVSVGDYLLAVNGTPLDTTKDPWAAFQGLVGQVVTLKVSAKPTLDDEAREVLVEPLDPGEESALRYRAWVEQNRAYVAQRSGDKVGYIHVPDTGTNGQNELFRQFYGQRRKAALVIDERWNGGGQLPHRFIELLNRPLTNYWATHDGRPSMSPDASHQGPKCMLINGLAGSGGDMFPYLFRQAGLGKLIGTRTWGGLVGISGNPSLIDGVYVSAPTFAFYELDGTWGIEGHGVDPDIEVIDDPALMVDGGDPQLDRAIEQMLAEIEQNPYVTVPIPAYPDRSGMKIREEDK